MRKIRPRNEKLNALFHFMAGRSVCGRVIPCRSRSFSGFRSLRSRYILPLAAGPCNKKAASAAVPGERSCRCFFRDSAPFSRAIPCRSPRGPAKHRMQPSGLRPNGLFLASNPYESKLSTGQNPKTAGRIRDQLHSFLRRVRDSNPRSLSAQQFSRLPPSTTRPTLLEKSRRIANIVIPGM